MYLNKKYGQSFEIIDDDMPDTSTTIQLSHFSLDRNPAITVTLSNFPVDFPDGNTSNVWAFFSTSFVNTNLNGADFRITKVLGKKRSNDEVLNQLISLWNDKVY